MGTSDHLGSNSAAIVHGTAPGLARAVRWATLPSDERRRQAAAAAQHHETAALCDLADAWLTLYGKAGATVSGHTRANYARGIRALLAAWKEENLLHPRQDAAALWLCSMQDGGLKHETIKVRLAGARALYAALRWAGATTDDPLRDAHPAKDLTPPWEKRKPYADADITALVSHAQGDDRALILLGAHAGLRVSEMLALRWADIDFGHHELTVVRGKGGKARTVAMSATLTAALRAWQQEGQRRETGNAADYVLPYRTAISARRRLRLVCERAGVKPRAVHSLRHAAGTRIVREGGDLERAARHLGHASLETARIYAKWSDEALKRQVGAW